LTALFSVYSTNTRDAAQPSVSSQELFMSLARSFFTPAALCASLLAQSQVIQPDKAEKTTQTLTLALASGSVLKVKNVNGFIRMEAWDREEVQFTGDFKPSSKDEQVKVVVEAGSHGMEIRGEYPKNTGWHLNYRGPECNMTLKVPRRVLPKLEAVNGEVDLRGTRGEADISTVNGLVSASDLEEALKVETVNGSINLSQVKGRLSLATVNGAINGSQLDGRGQGIKAETVNGAIHIQTAGLKGRLKAENVNGAISFSAKGAEQIEVKKHSVAATFPGSNQSIDLETVNGAITLD
jgi:hypothetical protein